MSTTNFDFLVSPETELSDEPQYTGPNLSTVKKMTPKKFAQAVLEVFDKLGGASWLMIQAQADPKSFLDLLKRMIPKSVQLDDLQGIQVNLIDQFGNTIQIQTNPSEESAISTEQKESGQLQIATGGSPPLAPASSTKPGVSYDSNFDFDIKETFE